jgi:thiamine-monophosphate kinase
MPLSEPEKIEKIVVPTFAAASRSAPLLLQGVSITTVLDSSDQDDCAMFQVAGQVDLVWGTDYIRGPKFSLFELGHLSLYDIGWYLAGANLSDIAAMGAAPIGLVSVVRYPKNMDDESFKLVLEGIRDGCSYCGTNNVGGDIGSAERLILSASALGAVERGCALTRTGAKVGQLLVLTGHTGLAGAAMKAATSGRAAVTDTEAFRLSLKKWKHVEPRFGHARVLARYARHVGACLDTSDGLVGAIEEIAKRSRVGISVQESMVPVHPAVTELAEFLDSDVSTIVFGDSVDFELLFTVDEEVVGEVTTALQEKELECFVIGRIEHDSGLRFIRTDGSTSAMPGVAWRH